MAKKIGELAPLGGGRSNTSWGSTAWYRIANTMSGDSLADKFPKDVERVELWLWGESIRMIVVTGRPLYGDDFSRLINEKKLILQKKMKGNEFIDAAEAA